MKSATDLLSVVYGMDFGDLNGSSHRLNVTALNTGALLTPVVLPAPTVLTWSADIDPNPAILGSEFNLVVSHSVFSTARLLISVESVMPALNLLTLKIVGVLNFVKRSLSSSHCGRRCPSSCRLAFSSGGSVITFFVLRICDGVLVFSSARISEHGGVADSCRKQELGPGYILAAE